VKVRYGFIKAVRWKIIEQSLKVAERLCRTVNMIQTLRGLVGLRSLNKEIYPPAVPVISFEKDPPVDCRDEVEGFPVRIAAVLHYLVPQMGRYAPDILHQLFRLSKDVVIDPLQDVAMDKTALFPEKHNISIVNMSNPIGTGFQELAITLKKSDNTCQARVHLASPHRLSGYTP
jgi:hypothetical protein